MAQTETNAAIVAELVALASDYAQTGRRPALHYRKTLRRLDAVTTRGDLLLAAAVHLAKARHWYSNEAVALLVGCGAPADVIYRQAWLGVV